MSRVSKLKHFQRENEADDLSLPTDKQKIVRVISSKGNCFKTDTVSKSKHCFLKETIFMKYQMAQKSIS
jgi:hypothetical protein